MHILRRREDGTAAIELGIVLPLLLVFLAFVAPIIKFGYDYMVVQRAVSHGVRYASRADINPSEFGRRPLPGQVATFVSDSSGGMVNAAAVTVSPDPSTALPGEVITVTVSHPISYGPIVDIANSVKAAFFGGSAFPATTTVTVSARGREE